MNLKKTFTIELWISIQLIILLIASNYIYTSNYENVEVLFVAVESILILPAGFITLYLNEIFSVHHYFSSHWTFFLFVLINWIVYAIIGYYQWFVLLPKLINKVKKADL